MNSDELRALVRALPGETSAPPRFTWERNCYELRRDILGQTQAKGLDQFLTWPTVRGTMVPGDNVHTRGKLTSLREDDWSRWEPIIQEPGFGGPAGFAPCPGTSGNLVTQASHLQQWESRTGVDVAHLDIILEFGGGYGALCFLVHRLGFRGTYYLYDLPEFSYLQEFYLTQVQCPGHIEYRSTKTTDWFADLPEVDVLIGMYSVSESTLDVRSLLMGNLVTNHYFFAYQPVFQGIDNITWFQSLQEKIPRRWTRWPIPHTVSNQHYLAGVLDD